MFLGLGKLDSGFAEPPKCLKLDPEVAEACDLWGLPVFRIPELVESVTSLWLLPKALEKNPGVLVADFWGLPKAFDFESWKSVLALPPKYLERFDSVEQVFGPEVLYERWPVIRFVFPEGFASKALLDLGFAVEASVEDLEDPTALAALSGDLRTIAWKRSRTDLCLPPEALPLEILTGEPLTLIKASVLPTDLLRRIFDVPELSLLRLSSLSCSLGRSGELEGESRGSGGALGGL